jgi:hypothetical protein
MGTTLWVLGQASVDSGDSWDHSALFDAAEPLDRLCAGLGVPPLSAFFDWTDFNANLSDEAFFDGATIEQTATWFEANAALPTLRSLRNHIAGTPEAIAGLDPLGYENLPQLLIEELEDCITKLEALAARGEPFHLCVVM